METQTWHQREATLEQDRRFQKIIALHTLTDMWTKALSPNLERPFQMERMARVTLNPNLWLFEKTRLDELPLELEKLVGSQPVEAFLNELSETVWIIQLSTLENAFSTSTQKEELLSVFRQTSWNHGKNFAEQLWSRTEFKDLGEAYQAFIESHPYDANAFIKERASQFELSFIWNKSPLQNRTLKNSPQASSLCMMHEEWIRGFFYSISRNIRMSSKTEPLSGKPVLHFNLLWTY